MSAFTSAPGARSRAVRVTRRAPRCRTLARSQQTEGSPRVASIGEALFDCLADQRGLSRAEVKSWTPYMGGAPLNVVCQTARLGVPSAFISAVGEDDLGDKILDKARERGIDVRGVQRTARPTRDIYVIRKMDGDREFAGFGQATEVYADAHLEATRLPAEVLRSCCVLVTGTLGLAQPATRQAMLRAVELVK